MDEVERESAEDFDALQGALDLSEKWAKSKAVAERLQFVDPIQENRDQLNLESIKCFVIRTTKKRVQSLAHDMFKKGNVKYVSGLFTDHIYIAYEKEEDVLAFVQLYNDENHEEGIKKNMNLGFINYSIDWISIDRWNSSVFKEQL